MARRIHLGRFVSRVAEPGERIVWPSFSSSLSLGDSSNHLTQTQRRKNWRIFMEACLRANGGTGAHNGAGWYAGNTASTSFNVADQGTVFVPGPLLIEPYDDSQYAPNWGSDAAGSRFWTLPSGIRLTGNGVSQGDGSTSGWSEVNPKGSRIICWDNYVGWYPRGGPAPAGGATRRHLSNFSWDNLSVMRKGTIAGPVFRAAHWTESDTGPVVHFVQFFRIPSMLIDMQPAGDAVENTGAEIRCGLTSRIDFLRVMAHGNAGFGLIYTGNYLISGTTQARSTTLTFGQLVVHGTGKGIGVSHADFFVDELNLEQTSSQTTTPQLLIGEAVNKLQIRRFWGENIRPVGSGTDGAIVVGETNANMVTAGVLPSGPTYSSGSGLPTEGQIDYVLLLGVSGAPLVAGVKMLFGRLTLGDIRGQHATTLLAVAPRVSDATAVIEYDSRRAVYPNVTNLVTTTPVGAKTWGYVVDRAQVDRTTPWIAATVDALWGSSDWWNRYWNKGHGAISTHRLPVATAADVGKRITVMKYDGAYAFRVTSQGGRNITAATQASTCTLTVVAHGFSNGQQKWVSEVGGMTELNGRYLYVKSIGVDTIELYEDAALTTPVNSSAYTAYTSGGKLGGQFIGANNVGVNVTIVDRYIPVTFEYLGDDRYAIVHGEEALS